MARRGNAKSSHSVTLTACNLLSSFWLFPHLVFVSPPSSLCLMFLRTVRAKSQFLLSNCVTNHISFCPNRWVSHKKYKNGARARGTTPMILKITIGLRQKNPGTQEGAEGRGWVGRGMNWVRVHNSFSGKEIFCKQCSDYNIDQRISRTEEGCRRGSSMGEVPL